MALGKMFLVSSGSKKRTKKSKKRKVPQASLRTHNVGYSSGITLWPKQYKARLRYKHTVTLGAVTTDVFNGVNMSMTSIYDPYVAAGGGTPKGYTDLAANYRHYVVDKCRMIVEYSGHTGNPMMICLSKNEDTTITNLTSRDDRLNDERTTYRLINSDSSAIGRLTATYDRRKVYGNKKNDELTAAFGANPVEQYYGIVGTINHGPGEAQASIIVTMTLIYDVTCLEKRDTPNS